MPPRDQEQERKYGTYLKPEVQNIISLTLAFAQAVSTAKEAKADNVVVSAYNALACLAMIAKGAEGQTREEMAKTLFGTDGEGLDAAANDYAALNTQVLEANKDQVTVSTANGVWANQDLVTLRQAYVEDLKQTMGADISAVNFGDPATIEAINNWADKHTNGLIKQIIESLSADDAAILTSALYFKGKWTNKFDVDLTKDKPFTGDGKQVSLTPMMHQEYGEDALKYVRGDDYEAVSMTYGELGQTDAGFKYPTMRMVLVRPTDESVSARDWLAAQDAAKVPAWLDNSAFRDAIGPVELPHIEVEQDHDAIPALKAMGIKSAFDGSADFSRMVERGGDRLYVSQVSHGVVFKTDELGSEGAAVTMGRMMLECMKPEPVKVDFKTDRSFVFAVQDLETGAVLFIGAVNKPNDEMKPVKAAALKL